MFKLLMLFSELASVFQEIEETSSRLKMTDILAGLFKSASEDEADKISYLLQGMVAPPFKGIDIGLGEKFVQQAISRAAGYPVTRIEKKYLETGDLGLVAEAFVSEKKQASLSSRDLTVSEVFNSFTKIARASGPKSQSVKINRLVDLLNNSSPLEAKYLVRIPLGRLRLGVGDPTILDALSTAFSGDKSMREVLERAYNLSSDIGLVARTLYGKGVKALEKFKVTPGVPLRPALCERLPTSEEIIEKIGKCAVEAKYDGVRLQCHITRGGDVFLFSRHQENMTKMFPDMVKALKKLPVKSVVLDCEALSYNEATGEYYSFQETVQRKRKHGVKEFAQDLPLRLFAFDIMHLNGKDVMEKPYVKRRALLEKVVDEHSDRIVLSEKSVVSEPAELQELFEDIVGRGLEGIIAKDLEAPYTAGARKFAWVKLKRSYKGELQDSIDAVILGYFKGKGHRARFGFGTLLAGVYDPKRDEFKTIAKVGTGFTEEQMQKLKEALDRISVKKRPARVDSNITPDVWVEPKYVVTLVADEITRSPVHTCGWTKGKGYALRFPRLASWFRDKLPEDSTSVVEVKDMYENQKRVKEN